MLINCLAEISGLNRKDANHFGRLPSVQVVCEVLNRVIAKLPAYSETVVIGATNMISLILRLVMSSTQAFA